MGPPKLGPPPGQEKQISVVFSQPRPHQRPKDGSRTAPFQTPWPPRPSSLSRATLLVRLRCRFSKTSPRAQPNLRRSSRALPTAFQLQDERFRPRLMAASLGGLRAGPGGLSRLFLLLLRPLLSWGDREDDTKSACGKPWWSEDVDGSRHWPWEVSLRVEDEHVCGGALVDHKWVVTAAHCIAGTKEYSVALGTAQLKPTHPRNAVSIPVKDIVVHPKFWGRTFTIGDVALLQLHAPVVFSKYVQPICLPEPTFDLKVGTQCWVTGWSQAKLRYSANSTLTPELQEAEVFIMDNKRCDQIYRKKSSIPHILPLILGDMICATNYGENLCNGDPGGPLACEVEDRWILAGVMSWEKACAQAQNPGVYTRVTKYSRWIKNQMSNRGLSGPCTSVWLLLLSWLLPPQMGP